MKILWIMERGQGDSWRPQCLEALNGCPTLYISSSILSRWPNQLILCPLTLWRLTTSCMSRTATLTSKRCILYIYSTNVGTENFKHALYSPFFSLQNAVCFIMLTCLVHVLFTFYIQAVLKLKENNSGAKGLIHFTILSPLLISSSSRFFRIFHSPFSYLGPYILLNIFLSKISTDCSPFRNVPLSLIVAVARQ
jgi:hypothetical protein